MSATERFPTPESLDETAVPHPFFAKALADLRAAEANGTAPPSAYDNEMLQKARAGRKALLDANYGEAPAGVDESILEVDMRDGFKAQNRVFKPTGSQGGLPLIMLVHGGGFCMGENRAMGALARAVVQLYTAVVVSVHYRLAPENPFPTSINDCWDTFLYLGKNAGSLGADPSKGFVVGGISAGGNVSAVITAQSLAQGIKPAVTGTWLSVSLVFHNLSVVPEEYKPFYKSMTQNAIAPVLDAKSIHRVNELLKPDPKSEWYCIAPLTLAGEYHPPTYVQVDGLDPLRDDGVIYEKILRKKGVKTRLTVWSGLPHAHTSFFPTEDFGISAINDTVKGLGWLLGAKEPEDAEIQKVMKPVAAPN